MAFTLVTSGCQKSPQPYAHTPENFAKGMAKVGELVSRYGELHVPQCNEQFKQVMERLGYSDQSGYTIRILSTNQPAAFSPGAKVILLSRGLIRLLNSESQVAFVIAHELSHYHLGHVEEASHIRTEQSSAWRKDLEIAADQKALALLIRGGYETTEAVTALQTVYRHVQGSNEKAIYPSLVERITSISQQIASAQRAIGPGTVNRRDFTRCRQSL
jgi:predicted Zn-dependent protease